MLDLLNNFIISYNDYSLYMAENFSFVDVNSTLGFAIYILILLFFLLLIKFIYDILISFLKLLKSLLHRKNIF